DVVARHFIRLHYAACVSPLVDDAPDTLCRRLASLTMCAVGVPSDLGESVDIAVQHVATDGVGDECWILCSSYAVYLGEVGEDGGVVVVSLVLGAALGSAISDP